MRDGNLHKIVTRENNKSIDGFNSQKETDKLTERLSNLEIFQDTDQSFSTKGPVVAKNEPGNHWRIDEVDPKVKNNLNLKDFHEKNQESEEENLENERLKEFLENKIWESKKEFQELSRQAEKEKDDLIAFPSEDENSRKQKNDAINDIELSESRTDTIEDEELKLKQLEDQIEESPRIEPGSKEIGFDKRLKSITTIQKSGTTVQKSEENGNFGFPSFAEETNIQDNERKDNFDIFNEGQNEGESLWSDNLLNYAIQEELNSHHSVDKKLETSSVNSEPPAKKILLSSNKSNILPTEKEERKSNPNLYEEEPSPYNENEQSKNIFNSSPELYIADNIPELPSNLDINDISEVMPVPNQVEEDEGKLFR